MNSTLVVGASRGLGRGFVEQLLARGEQVIATTRSEADAGALRAMAESTGAAERRWDVMSRSMHRARHCQKRSPVGQFTG